MHCTSRPVRPEAAWANQLPGVQLLVRNTDTLKERVQAYGEVPLYWRCGHGTCCACQVRITHAQQPRDTPWPRKERNVQARHGLIDLEVEATGDLHIDGHHTVEDVGITLGQAVAQAVGDKKGITRYGHAYVPLDEALSRVVVDFSGRPGLHMDVPFKAGMIGAFDTQLTYEFFQGFSNHALVTLHIDNLKGENAHHQCETVFKAFARALRMALTPDPRSAGVIPSTKGTL